MKNLNKIHAMFADEAPTPMETEEGEKKEKKEELAASAEEVGKISACSM